MHAYEYLLDTNRFKNLYMKTEWPIELKLRNSSVKFYPLSTPNKEQLPVVNFHHYSILFGDRVPANVNNIMIILAPRLLFKNGNHF